MKMAIWVMMAAAVAGVTQTVTGFGAGIVIMMVLPLFFPVVSAAAINSSICTALALGLAWHYRRQVRWKLILWSAICFGTASTLAVTYLSALKSDLLLKLLGVCLMALSIYFLFFSQKLRVKATTGTAMVCAGISGTLGGLFGIGGPPMVIYYLAALEGKEEYLGTLQMFFAITGGYICLLRALQGTYTADMVPLTLLGILATLLGMQVGRRIVDRMDEQVMRKVIYVFLAITGVLNIL